MELTPGDFARLLRRAADTLAPQVQAAEARALRDVQERMLFWTSGGETLKELRRADHPYARRHGIRRRHAVLINRQSGALQESLGGNEPVESEGGTLAAAFFTVPHGRYLFDPASDYADGGTQVMFGRDVPSQVVDELEEARTARFEATIADLFR